MQVITRRGRNSCECKFGKQTNSINDMNCIKFMEKNYILQQNYAAVQNKSLNNYTCKALVG